MGAAAHLGRAHTCGGRELAAGHVHGARGQPTGRRTDREASHRPEAAVCGSESTGNDPTELGALPTFSDRGCSITGYLI